MQVSFNCAILFSYGTQNLSTHAPRKKSPESSRDFFIWEQATVRSFFRARQSVRLGDTFLSQLRLRCSLLLFWNGRYG